MRGGLCGIAAVFVLILAVVACAPGTDEAEGSPIAVGGHPLSGKPAPEIYQLAAARLGVSPGACVAIEDSRNGVRAAKAAGMACIAVPEPWASADLTLPTLEALTAQHLQVPNGSGQGTSRS